MSQSSGTAVERDQLRRAGRSARESIDGNDRTTAERLISAHLASLQIASGATVGSFLSDDGEPRLDAFVERLRDCDCALALPVPEAGRRADGSPVRLTQRQMYFRPWSESEDLVEGPFGIPIPAERSDGGTVVPDVLLVPLVAFDAFGNRLGRGAGFYDRYLDASRTATGKRPLAIGIGFEGQRAAAIPAQPYDELLDVIVTELGIRWIVPKGTA